MFCLRISPAVMAIVVCLNFFIASSHEVRAASSTLLLSEVQTAGAGDSSQEFIEIYNAGSSDMFLDDMRVAYRSAKGETDTTVYRFTVDDMIRSHGYFLLVRSNKNVGRTPDALFETGLANAGGGLALRESDNRIVDSLGWGTASNVFVEGTAAVAPDAGSSLERVVLLDTDNNGTDFRIQLAPNPRNSEDSTAVPIPTTFLTFGVSALVLAISRLRIGLCA